MLSSEKSIISQEIDKKIRIETLFTQLGFKDVKRIGDRITFVCPFHEGADNPNAFSYRASLGTGYCFTKCNKSYDIFDIIMKAKNCDFKDALEFISSVIGKEINYINKTNTNADNLNFLRQVKKVRDKKKNNEISVFDTKILETFVPKLHTKLRQEGFNEETKNYFQLGFAFEGYFANRITIPIDNQDGSILTVSGRSIKSQEDLEFENERKYLLYYDVDKSQTLYNISRAELFIEMTKEVIVVEGFKSVWRLHQWGIHNAVAVMGSTISDKQVDILLKTGAKIIVCGDRDSAGQGLNKKVKEKCSKFSDVYIMNMFELDVPEKSSISDITKQQFEFIYNNKKGGQ